MDTEKALKNLEKHGFKTHWFDTKEAAADFLCGELHGLTVGFGGCMTAQQMGLYEKLGKHNRVFWHWRSEDMDAARQAAAKADVYILSANALAETGEIVNIDGNGNRLAAAMYGHQKVIFVVGVNKLTPDLASAVDRARNVASPLNARRLNCKTPCALSEPMHCHDCSSPERICNGLCILYARMKSIPEMDVLLIGEELGY